MLHDPAFSATLGAAKPRRQPRARRTGAERLTQAVLALAGPHAHLVSHRETAWASITFAGARHTIVLGFEGWEACDDADHVIAALPDHEFALPGVLVADATVTRTQQTLLPDAHMEVEVELLLLNEG